MQTRVKHGAPLQNLKSEKIKMDSNGCACTCAGNFITRWYGVFLVDGRLHTQESTLSSLCVGKTDKCTCADKYVQSAR